MNKPEAITLCRIAKAACPQQAVDEYTPDAWFELLGDLRFVDAKEALIAVAKRQPFVAPAEIRAEVKRIRHDRLMEFGPFEPPAELDPADYSRWLGETRRRICDGDPFDPEELAAIHARPRNMPDLEALMPRVER